MFHLLDFHNITSRVKNQCMLKQASALDRQEVCCKLERLWGL